MAVLYLIAINVFLGTRLFRNLVNTDPSSLLVEYDSATSFVPGKAHVRGLRIRGKDSHVEWRLEIDEADLSVSLGGLFHRHFHVTKVHGAGVAFYARRRLDPADATAEVVAALPPIAGLEYVPLKDAVPSPPPNPDELWRADLDDVTAEGVREIWVDTARFRGSARVIGSLSLAPLRRLAVGPAAMEIVSGELTSGADAIVANVRGRAEITVGPYDPSDRSGLDILHEVSGRADLDGDVPSLAYVARRLASTGLELSDGGGELHVAAALERGVIAEGSLVRFDSEHVALGMAAHVATLGARATLAAEATELTLLLEARNVDFHRAGLEASPVRAPKLAVLARTTGRDVAEPLALRALGVDLPAAVVTNANVLDAALSKGGAFSIEGGRGTLDAHADLAGASASGSATLLVTGLAVRFRDTRLRGDAALHLHLGRGDPAAGWLDFSGSRLELKDVAVVKPSDRRAPSVGMWWGKFDLPVARVSVVKPARVDLSFSAQCGDARPINALFVANRDMPEWAASVFTLEGLAATGRLRVEASSVELRSLRAKGGSFEIAASYAEHGERKAGAALVTWGPKSVGLDVHDSATSPVLVGAAEWFASRERALFAPPVRTPAVARWLLGR